jgi:hypothetical protein
MDKTMVGREKFHIVIGMMSFFFTFHYKKREIENMGEAIVWQQPNIDMKARLAGDLQILPVSEIGEAQVSEFLMRNFETDKEELFLLKTIPDIQIHHDDEDQFYAQF